VWESFGRGEIAAIRDYCEADCANTYLLYLRFQMMRCVHTPEHYASECALLRSLLEKRPEPHWRRFLSLWKS
jgi:3'-5' exonuclease